MGKITWHRKKKKKKKKEKRKKKKKTINKDNEMVDSPIAQIKRY